MKKKGVSPMIATVLLIFFAIALGAVIMNWGSNYAGLQENIDQKTEEAQIRCERFVKITALKDDTQEFCVLSIKKLLKFKIQNDGDIPIKGMRVVLIGEKNFETTFFDLEDLNIQPGTSEAFSQTYDFERLGKVAQMEITPTIDMGIEGMDHRCQQKLEVTNIADC